jgi:hypothetical protein
MNPPAQCRFQFFQHGGAGSGNRNGGPCPMQRPGNTGADAAGGSGD